jgi:ribosomal protein S20
MNDTDEANKYWKLAAENLTEAIKIRDQTDFNKDSLDTGDPQEAFWHYELHRLLCYYKLDRDKKRAEDELKTIKKTWLNKTDGVLASLFKTLDKEFIEWIKSQDKYLIPEKLDPTIIDSKSSKRVIHKKNDGQDSHESDIDEDHGSTF